MTCENLMTKAITYAKRSRNCDSNHKVIKKNKLLKASAFLYSFLKWIYCHELNFSTRILVRKVSRCFRSKAVFQLLMIRRLLFVPLYEGHPIKNETFSIVE